MVAENIKCGDCKHHVTKDAVSEVTQKPRKGKKRSRKQRTKTVLTNFGYCEKYERNERADKFFGFCAGANRTDDVKRPVLVPTA